MEQVNITPEDKPDENLLNAQNADANKPPEGDKPPEGEKLFAGKYKSVEELEKGYTELVKKLGAPKTEDKPPEGDKPDLKIEDKPPETPAPDAGFQKFFDEYAQTGTISEASYKELEAKGLPKAVVDSYIDGQKLQFEKQAQSVYSLVGGQEKYSEMTTWAKDNLTEDEKLAFNQAVIGTPAQAQLAVQGLYLKFQQANKTPNLVFGNEGGTATGDVYQSRAQMISDMQSELYKKDPAERKRVAEKLARSKIM